MKDESKKFDVKTGGGLHMQDLSADAVASLVKTLITGKREPSLSIFIEDAKKGKA